MVSIQQVGSNVEIVYSTMSPTFTADQLFKALKERDFIPVQGQAAESRNPNAPPINIPAFSKQNVNILYNPPRNQLVIQIINTIDLSQMLEDLKPILVCLNITTEIVSTVKFTCRTSVWSSKTPLQNLTKIVDSNFINDISSILFRPGLTVSGMKIGATSEDGKENIQIILEPLGTNPQKQYYLAMSYSTRDISKFNEFISGFGESMISKIIEELENKNV